MSIQKYGSEILRRKTKPVTEFDGRLTEITERMKKLMDEANGIGLAANQVGLDMAMFIAKLGEETYALVNPVVSPLSAETEKNEEGCLSIPGVWIDIERYVKIRLHAQNVKGDALDLELEGFPARVVQHEVDHLNGILIVDRIEPDLRRKLADQLEAIKTKVQL